MNSYDDDSSSKTKIQKIIEDDDDVIFLDSSSSSTLTTTISASSSTSSSGRRKNVKPKSFPTELEPIKPLLGNVKKFYQKCTSQNLSKEDKLKEMFTFMQWYGKVDKSPITLGETNENKSEMIGSKSRKTFLDHEINKRKLLTKPTKLLPAKYVADDEPEEDEYFLEDFSNDSYSSNEDDDDDDWIGDNLKRSYKPKNPRKKNVSNTISKINHHHHLDRSSCSSFDSFLNTSAGISMIDNSSSCSSDGDIENESSRPKTDEKFNNYFQKIRSKLKSNTSDSQINPGPSGINTSGDREKEEKVPLTCRIDPDSGTSGNNVGVSPKTSEIRIEEEEDDDDVILLETKTDQSVPQHSAPSIIDQSRPVASSIANYVEIDYEITDKVKSKVMKKKKISKKSRKKSKNKNETDSELEDDDEEEEVEDEEYSDDDEDFDPDRPFPGTKEYYDWIYRKRLRKIHRRKEIKREEASQNSRRFNGRSSSSSMVEVEVETAEQRKSHARKCLKQLTKRTDLDPAQKKQKLRYYRRIIDETESDHERRMEEVARYQRNKQRNLARFDPSIIVPSIESDDDPSDLDWGQSQLQQQHYFSDEQLKEQRKKLKQFRKQLISNESPEQRERRLKLIRQLARKQYKRLDKEQRKLFLEQMRKKYEERRKKRMADEQNCVDKTISLENRPIIVDESKSTCTTIVETATEMIDFDSINDTFINTTANSVSNLTAQFDPNWI